MSNGAAWTEDDDDELQRLLEDEASMSLIAAALDRSPGAIAARMHKRGLKKRGFTRPASEIVQIVRAASPMISGLELALSTRCPRCSAEPHVHCQTPSEGRMHRERWFASQQR